MAKTPEQVNLHIVFCGDIMTHGNQIRAAKNEDGSYDFSRYFDNTRSYIQAADLAVCNCETTMAGGDTYTGYPRFNTPDALADAIKGAGFSVVATANNHSYDSKCTGIIRTRSVLESRGLQVIGTKKAAQEKAWAIVERKGVKIAVLNYTYETAKYNGAKTLNNRALDPEAESLLNSFCYETLEEDLARIEHDIQEVRQNGAEVILVYYHWGNEYERTSNVLQKYIAYRTARMGADAIIGSHAHVLQEQGEITVGEKRVPVFYGLGNYIWGYPPMKGRDTVLNTILAHLDIAFDTQKRAVSFVEPSYTPLCIHFRPKKFDVLDLTNPAAAAPSEDGNPPLSDNEAESIRQEINRTITNQVHPAKVTLFFDTIFAVETGTMRSVRDFLPESEKYLVYKSEDAIIASALKNGFIVGNRPGYTGITAVDRDGNETAFMVHVSGNKESLLPVFVNENNRVRDIYTPSDSVTGEKYALPEGISCCRSTAVAWKNMLHAAREDGVYLKLVSGRRSKKAQLQRQNSYAERYGDAAAKRRYQNFGCSEHHLGTALDINGGSYNGKTSTKEQAIIWVQKNGHKFGFINRKLKSTMANAAYVHVRYVNDVKLARYMTEKELTLEQYLLDYGTSSDQTEGQKCAET